MSRSKDWLVPLTGVAFFALVIAAFALTGAAGDSANAKEKTAQEIVDYYKDNKDTQMAGASLLGLAGVFFLFFAGWVRKVLHEAEGGGRALSVVSMAGATVFAAGIGVGATFHFVLADLADELDPIAVQAINGLDYDFFIPLVIGMSTFMLATGISAVRHGAMPKWVGWAAIVIGVISFSPAGFFGFLVSLVWVLGVSIMLSLRARRGAPTPAGGG